jgi:hypothetical protein
MRDRWLISYEFLPLKIGEVALPTPGYAWSSTTFADKDSMIGRGVAEWLNWPLARA